MEKFICPGRTHDIQIKDQWNVRGKCSYCGSITTAYFFYLIEAGKKVVASKETRTFYFDKDTKLCYHHLSIDEQERLKTLYKEGKLNIINRADQVDKMKA